jgi:amino acid transporter
MSNKIIGTKDVFIAGVAIVVAASTLVSDFNGYFTLGASFVIALLLGFLINFFLAVSAAELSSRYPRSGAIYSYGKAIFAGHAGVFIGTFLGLSFLACLLLPSPVKRQQAHWGYKRLLGPIHRSITPLLP